MSASWIGNMSTPRVKVPLLLLLLTTVLPGTGFGQEEMEQSGSGNDTVTTVVTDTSIVINQTSSNGTLYEGSASGSVATSIDENSMDETESPGLDPIIIIIPAVLVVLIICMIVCGIFINRRWNKQKRNPDLSKEDPYLDGSSTEKVPMPMFEEDVPSVLELEMEELDEWMKKDGETAEDSKRL
ncbi:transmembrane protein 154 isoform X1 [Simochromis diagramma]|uniref:transmembrane protein 154 isoform X1 n=1 Tax=Simochromis diagramma TaxID=43689 RepID=UPI001A7E9763|nr:transmembrane protein 154 isoform X1 [Simochromis diagramma]